MSPPNPFDGGKPRPIATVLDSLRARFDPERIDAAVIWLECVAADLGYGDVRPLPGAIAWLGELHDAGMRLALAAEGERAPTALELAGVEDIFDEVVNGPRQPKTLSDALSQLEVEPSSAVLIDAAPAGIAAGRETGFDLLIGVARGLGSPEELRGAGADMIVADLQELIGAARGRDR